MQTLKKKVEDFFAQKRIAVVGVSSKSEQGAAQSIYRKLKAAGYRVYPVNQHGGTVDGEACVRDLAHIEGPVDGVVAVTRPEATEQIARQCADLGIEGLWMHRSFGEGSVSEEAVAFCQEHGISVIAGGCPMMFCPPVDFGHRCMRWMLRAMNRLPA